MNIILFSQSGKRMVAAVTAVATVLFLTVTSFAAATVNPPIVEDTLPPGGSTEVEKEVTTPNIPADPEICFLADTTGSMGPALANVAANISTIMNTVAIAQPTAEFCAAQYKDDTEFDPFAFQMDQTLTTNTAAVQAAIGTWAAGGGDDVPEAQLHALYEIANSAAGYDGPNRIIVWFGDASGHDPSLGTSLADAISALQGAGITVIAIPVDTGLADGLDNTGQATAITDQTGGILLPDAAPDEVSGAILTGLTSLTTDVWHELLSCDDGLTVELEPDVHEDVAGGDSVAFDETIEVDNDPALGGQTLSCIVVFLSNSYPDGGAPIGRQLITITVPDETPPLAECVETVNPHGRTTPPAGSTTLPGPKGGQNEDGFYELVASDEGSGVAEITVNGFGPFLPGDKIKVTEAPGGKPKMQPMGSGNGQADAIAAHLLLDSDPVMTVIDIAGNETEVSCLVPPPPK